jgi:hypothetical protein
MRISIRRAGAVAGLLALAAVTAFAARPRPAAGSRAPSQAMAEAAKGASGGSGGLKVIATGLNNPRGIGIGPDGALYVAESGKGGAGPCIPGPEGDQACFGRTGSVTRITRHSQQRVLTGLPSAAAPDGTAASGPVDLGFSGWTGYLLVGNPGGGTGTREQFGPGLAASASCSRSTCAASGRWPTSRASRRTTTPTGRGAQPGSRSTATPTGCWSATAPST